MIHSSLWFKEIKEYRKLFLFCLLFTILLGIIIPYYYDQVLELPGNISAWEGITASSLHETSWLQWTSVVLLQLAVITGIVLGFSSLSRELTGQTLGFLLSKPVSRREIVTTKAVVGVTLLIFYIFGTSLLFGLLSWKYGVGFPGPDSFFLSATVTFIISVIAYMTAFFFSALFSRSWLSALASILLWGAMFIPELNIAYEDYGIFSAMQEAGFWLGEENAFIPIGIGIVLAGIFYELAVYTWSRREY